MPQDISRGPLLDMTPDGRFRAPARPSWAGYVALAAAVLAVASGLLAGAVLLLWLAFILLPVAFVAGAVAVLAFRYRAWRLRRARASGPGQPARF